MVAAKVSIAATAFMFTAPSPPPELAASSRSRLGPSRRFPLSPSRESISTTAPLVHVLAHLPRKRGEGVHLVRALAGDKGGIEDLEEGLANEVARGHLRENLAIPLPRENLCPQCLCQ